MKTVSIAMCQLCVWKEHPNMLTGYCLREHTCRRCGRVTDCALVKPKEEPNASNAR